MQSTDSLCRSCSQSRTDSALSGFFETGSAGRLRAPEILRSPANAKIQIADRKRFRQEDIVWKDMQHRLLLDISVIT